MKIAIDSQYSRFNARIKPLRDTETLLAINSLAIHRILEFNGYLGEGVGEFQKNRIGYCG